MNIHKTNCINILLVFACLPSVFTNEIDNKLAQEYDYLAHQATEYFGYPERPDNQEMHEALFPFYQFHLNNIGDPWQNGNWQLHTKPYEREAITIMAEMYSISHDYWGYITDGGTHGNIFGLYLGRKILRNRNKNKQTVIIATDAAHYSIDKAADILDVPLFKSRTDRTGEVDYNDLSDLIQKQRDKNMLIVVNLGTTMTGAMDSPQKIITILKEHNISHYYIHADAALHGMFYPFMQDADNLFAIGVNSIAISGHKFLGMLSPSGIFLTKKSTHSQAFNKTARISIINAHDTPLAGSRDGLLALKFWYLLKQKGLTGLQKDYIHSVSLAAYLCRRLKEIGVEDVIHVPRQPIVAFPLYNSTIAKRFQLPIDTNNQTHVICRPDMSRHDIDKLIDNLSQYRITDTTITN